MRSTAARTSRRPRKRPSASPPGSATSRTRNDELLGLSARTKGAYFAPRKFGPPERDICGIEKYAGRLLAVPRSWAVTEPRLGWKLTKAPQKTGIRVGDPVI